MLNRIKGLGLREKALRAIGAGHVYDRVAQLEAERHQLASAVRQAEARHDAGEKARRAALEQHEHERREADAKQRSEAEAKSYLDELRSSDRLVEIDYPVRPRVRFGWDQPPHPQLFRLLSSRDDHYRGVLRSFLPLLETAARIAPRTAGSSGEPQWINDWLPAFDAISLYGFIATRRPRRFLEIGSGNSTLFARRAVRDWSPGTTIVSVDPAPRAEVDAQCDEVIRMPLEQVPLSVFEGVTPDDIVFFDGSHRAFQNSDVTVFFTEILPMLPAGTLVGVHDIFLPYDYPQIWLGRWYSEQYLLASWLLGGERLRVELPVAHCGHVPSIHSVLAPFWNHAALADAAHHGGIFWFSVAERP